jgi:membrane-bound lytic murein transglycosylase B
MLRRFHNTRVFIQIFAAMLVIAVLLGATPAVPVPAFADEVSEKEEQLRAELKRIEAEKAEVQKVLDAARGESASISRDIAILTAEIKKAQLNIQQLNVSIGNLARDIGLKEQSIEELLAKMELAKEALAELIQTSQIQAEYTLPEMVLGTGDLSDFFIEIDRSRDVEESLDTLLDDIAAAKNETEVERDDLSVKREEKLSVKAQIEAERRTIAAKEAEKQRLLSANKVVERGYEAEIAEKEKKAAAIRTALFQLRDTKGIEFGQALEYANAASKATGVRPAFILGILKQETDLGNNVGTCNRPGDPEEKSWKYIMPGPNDGYRSYRDDQTVFLEIMEELGRDPDGTPLSCPWGTGWGGAMGPSQFIPTTWKAYASRIESSLGVKIADPWNPEHAFTATAIYVSDLGASAQTYDAERTAALKYYAGSNWASPQNAFYGNSVMAHAEAFQANIDFLKDADDD